MKRFEHMEHPAKLLDYFLRSNKSNINQWMRITFAINSSVSHSWSPLSISFTKRWIRFWNGIGACLKRSAGTSETPGALCDGIRAINSSWENCRKVVTGSRIVSPLGIVWKSNMPALSRKDLSLMWCLLLRKFGGSIVKQVSLSQKCSMFRVGGVCSGWVLWDVVDKGMGPVFPHSRLPQMAKGW